MTSQWRAALAGATALVLAACAIAFGSTALDAQERPGALVHGTVVLAGEGSPLSGAYVGLVDGAGSGVAGAASGADGSFQLVLSVLDRGPYRLRAARTGVGTWTSNPLDLEEGEELDIRIELEVAASRVAALRADAEARCAQARRGPGEPDEIGSIVVGQVRDGQTGQPVAEAQVWLRRGDDSEPVPLESGPSGTFLLCGLEPGPAELQAAAPGRLGPALPIAADAAEPFLVRDLVISRSMLTEVMESEGGERASLRGQVRSAETGEPVAQARVSLPEAGVSRVTDGEGRFLISGLARRPYHVVTEYLGASSDTVPVDLSRGSVTMALLTLETEPVALPELTVEVERTVRSPRLGAFYERVDRGLGEFLTREDLESTDLVGGFRRLQGVSVEQCVVGFTRRTGCYTLNLRRGRGIGASCQPVVYLDGHLLPAAGGYENAFTLLRSVEASIEGVEVYRNPAHAPVRFRTLGAECGIVLAWTRGR